MVAVPLPPTVERDQEQARRLEARSCSCAPDSPRSGIAQRRTQLIEHRRAPQEPLGALGQLGQRLAVQVVGHVPVVTGDRQRLAVAVARDQRGEVEADRPAFGPLGHRGRQLRSEADVRRGEDLLGAGRVEGQVARPELQRVARRPQPRQVRLLGTTRRDQLRASRDPRDHHAQHVVTGRRLQLVKVVQHEHERIRARPERRGEAGRRASQHRDAETAHVGDQVGVARRDPGVRGRQQGEQDRRIVVEAVERHPRDATILREGPLGQQRRLAVARGRGDADHPAVARAGRLDELGAAHGPRAGRRDRELGVEQPTRRARRRRRARIGAHARTHQESLETSRTGDKTL